MSENRKVSALPPDVLNETVRLALLEVAKMQDLEERAEEVAERTARLAYSCCSSATEYRQTLGNRDASGGSG